MADGDPLIIGQANEEIQGTLLNNFSPTWAGYAAFTVESTYHAAVRGVSEQGVGVDGLGTRVGTIGMSPDGPGVHGRSLSSLGVLGESRRNAGVFAISDGYVGVFGSGPAGGVRCLQ